MPSFLADEIDQSPVFSQSPGALHLVDPAAEYGLPAAKANGHIAPRPPQSLTSHESFDESSSRSTHSTQMSDASSDARPLGAEPRSRTASPYPPADADRLPDGFRTPPAKHAVQNGHREAAGADGHEDVRGPRPLQNGVARTASPDRGVVVPPPRLLTNGIKEGTPPSPTQPDSHSTPDSLHRSSADGRAPETSTTPTLTTIPSGAALTSFAAASSPSLVPGTPSQESAGQRTPRPHRVSSPPIPQASLIAGSGSTSHLPPPGLGLKHSHTLQVPGASGRPSRDSGESTFASGRFSPIGAAAGGRRPSLSLARRNTRSQQSEVPREEVVPDEDAQRWAEAYRQKRASKRRRREEDDDHVLVGTKVDETHANWETAYNMLTGIRVSVSRTNAKLDRPLTNADFEAKQKSNFDM